MKLSKAQNDLLQKVHLGKLVLEVVTTVDHRYKRRSYGVRDQITAESLVKKGILELESLTSVQRYKNSGSKETLTYSYKLLDTVSKIA